MKSDDVITVPLMCTDTINRNNRIYNKNALKKAFTDYCFDNGTVTLSNTDSSTSICGILNHIEYECDTIFADIKLVGPYKKIIKSLLESSEPKNISMVQI